MRERAVDKGGGADRYGICRADDRCRARCVLRAGCTSGYAADFASVAGQRNADRVENQQLRPRDSRFRQCGVLDSRNAAREL